MYLDRIIVNKMFYFVLLSLVLTLLLYYMVAKHDAQKDESKNEQFIRQTNKNTYEVKEFPNFLTEEECDQIIALSKNKLFESRVYDGADDLYETQWRQSSQCWLHDTEELVDKISQKVKDITNSHHLPQEHLQVVNYKQGGFFSPHYDACQGTPEFCARMNGDEGPRYLTLLIYLNDGYEGGETVFPHHNVQKTVKPKKGKAVLFQSVDEDGEIIPEALHGGQPVKSGEKWIANKWIRLGGK